MGLSRRYFVNLRIHSPKDSVCGLIPSSMQRFFAASSPSCEMVAFGAVAGTANCVGAAVDRGPTVSLTPSSVIEIVVIVAGALGC